MNVLTPYINAVVHAVVRIETVALREMPARQAERGLLSIYQKITAIAIRRPRTRIELIDSKSHSWGEYTGWRLYSVVAVCGSGPTSETGAGSYEGVFGVLLNPAMVTVRGYGYVIGMAFERYSQHEDEIARSTAECRRRVARLIYA